ncbi:MAG: ArsR family transcriptional regulator [Candidatus Methanomethylophilaceae archaeon]|nr:ArsR family transcriptional regulator [Candidatus Methanomethylophilaceae archaeon]
MDVDQLLAVINNPTRRRIIEALTREPHYPLQLSKELRVSQPAIIKHLKMLEENGLVSSYTESSNRGPERKQYVTNTEFTLVVDMRDGMFSTHLHIPERERTQSEKDGKEKEIRDIMEARREVGRIDEELKELEKIRSKIMERRREMISAVSSLIDIDEGHYRARTLLYEMLNNPTMTIDEIAKKLSMNREECEELLEDMMKDITMKEDREEV